MFRCSGVPDRVPVFRSVPVFRCSESCSGVPVFWVVPGCSGVPGFSTSPYFWIYFRNVWEFFAVSAVACLPNRQKVSLTDL